MKFGSGEFYEKIPVLSASIYICQQQQQQQQQQQRQKTVY